MAIMGVPGVYSTVAGSFRGPVARNRHRVHTRLASASRCLLAVERAPRIRRQQLLPVSSALPLAALVAFPRVPSWTWLRRPQRSLNVNEGPETMLRRTRISVKMHPSQMAGRPLDQEPERTRKRMGSSQMAGRLPTSRRHRSGASPRHLSNRVINNYRQPAARFDGPRQVRPHPHAGPHLRLIDQRAHEARLHLQQ
jgi:hypothetical protein